MIYWLICGVYGDYMVVGGVYIYLVVDFVICICCFCLGCWFGDDLFIKQGIVGVSVDICIVIYIVCVEQCWFFVDCNVCCIVVFSYFLDELVLYFFVNVDVVFVIDVVIYVDFEVWVVVVLEQFIFKFVVWWYIIFGQ